MALVAHLAWLFGAKGAQKEAKWNPNAPKWTQRNAKMSPKSLKSERQGAPRSRLGSSVAAWAPLGAPTPQNITKIVPIYHPNCTF